MSRSISNSSHCLSSVGRYLPKRFARRFPFLLALFSSSILSLHTVVASAAPKADLWSYWNKSDESSGRSIDHSAWSTLLEQYVSTDPSGTALVDYAALKKADAETLDSYVDSLISVDPRSLRLDEQMAYWINLYNALTVQVVLDAYPVSSIKKVKGGFFNSGPWDETLAKVAGKPVTLNDIEHRILRPIWKDKRIHYAVNCAAIGCPNLAMTAYLPNQLGSQLDNAASIFINQAKGVEKKGEGRFTLSSIYDWYSVDFGSQKALFEHLSKFSEKPLLEAGESPSKIDYEYDWSLNER